MLKSQQYQKAALFILAVLVIAGGTAYLASTVNPESTLQTKDRTLTVTGDITQAALSPDGRRVIYGKDNGDGSQSLWSRMIEAGEPEPIGSTDKLVSYYELTFSRDGKDVYYVKYKGTETTGTLYRLSVQAERKQEEVIKNGVPRFFTFAVSPDGGRLAFVWKEEGREARQQTSALRVMNIADGSERQVGPRRRADHYLAVAPAWKPDGKTVICAARNDDHWRVDLAEIEVGVGPADGGGAEKVFTTLSSGFVRNLAWMSDGRGLLVSLANHAYGPFQITYISYPDGVRQQALTKSSDNYVGLSMSGDSKGLVAVKDSLEAAVWVAENREEGGARPLRLKTGELRGGPNDFYGFAWTADGKEIIYELLDPTSGRQNLFRKNVEDDSDPVNLTNNVGDNYDPSVTPDNKFVVFASTRTGKTNIWKMDLNGRNQTLLTHGERDFVPFSSKDGWVYYTSEVDRRYTLRKVSVEGGQDQQLLPNRTLFWPAVSEDGKRIVSFVDHEGRVSLTVIPAEGGNPTLLPLPTTANTWGELRWVESEGEGGGVTFIDTAKDPSDNFVSNLWLRPWADAEAEPRQLTRFTSGRIFRYAWSPGGDRLVFSRGRITKDVHLISIDRPTRLEEIADHPVVRRAGENSGWLIGGAVILAAIYVLYFVSLPLDVIADLYPPLNVLATFLYLVRGGDWRVFRAYRENLRAQLRRENADSFYKPLPVMREGREHIPAEEVVGRVLELIDERPVLITGPGGAGKSTLLRQLVLGSLDGEQLKRRLPVFISPDADEDTSLKDQLAAYMKETGSYINRPVLEAQLKKGRFFFIIDGVSELTDAEAQRLWDQMHTLFPLGDKKGQENVLALAGRYYEGVEFRLSPVGSTRVPCRVELLEVNFDDLRTFCGEYLAVKRGQDPEKIPEDETGSLAEHIRGLPRIPLIIRLAVDEYERKGQAPASTLELFKNSLELISPKERLQVYRPALFALMHHLAWKKFVREGQREVSEEQLIDLISKIGSETDLWRRYQGEEVTMKTIVHDLLHSGIMIRQRSRIRFWHDSFEDYLCAYHFYWQWSAAPEELLADLHRMKAERIYSEVVEFISRIEREKQDPKLRAALDEPAPSESAAAAAAVPEFIPSPS